MPITPIHLPFVMLFFLLVAIPFTVSLLMFIPSPLRTAARRLLCGSVGAASALVAYQLAYLPFLALGLLFSLLLGWLFRGRSTGEPIIGVVLFMLFYVFWFCALLWGYISGFRVGWRFGSGTPLRESLHTDYLSRGCLAGFLRFRRRKQNGTVD